MSSQKSADAGSPVLPAFSARQGDLPAPLESHSFTVESSKTDETLKALKGRLIPPQPLNEDHRRILAEVRQITGEKDWPNWAGYWTKRVKVHPSIVERCIGEYRYAIATGRVIRNPGGYLFSLYEAWTKAGARQ